MRSWMLAQLAESLSCPKPGLWYRINRFLREPSSKRLSAAAVSLCSLKPDQRVLEVGFGGGHGLAEAVKTGANVVGIEVSSMALELTYKRLKTHVDKHEVLLLQISVESMPFPSNWFDAAYHVNSYPFWSRLDLASAELFRVLRPGGVILCTLDAQALQRDTQRGLYKHVTGSSSDPNVYMEALETAGFTQITFRSHDKEMHHPYQSINALKPG